MPVIGSECLIPYIKSSGYVINFADVDSYDIDDAFAVSNYYHDLSVGTETVLQLQGRNLANRKDIFLKEFQDNTNISYSLTSQYMSEGMAKAKMIDKGFNSEGMFMALDFRGYRIGGLNFVATGMAEFDDTYGMGRLGWKDVQINMPLGTFQSEDKTMVPYIGLEWRGKDGYSRMNEVWSTGGAGRVASIAQFNKCLEDDGFNLFLRAELAPHFALGIQFVIEKPSATVI
jgi:hypothetical protein